MTRLVLVAALAACASFPVAANATESCYYRSGSIYVCRDAEYRACLLYGSLGPSVTNFEVGTGCP
jgi:hypothetical protein